MDKPIDDSLDHFSIRTAMGSEFEFTNIVPLEINYEKFPNASLRAVFGEWGWMIFQNVKVAGISAWYSQYLINCPMEFEGAANRPLTELHNSIENYFINNWDGIGLPSEKEGQGGFSHTPFVNNKVKFPEAKIYRTFDFHFDHEYLTPYLNAYPKLYEMVNYAEKKESNQIDLLLQLSAEQKMIINQIKKYSSAMPERYLQAKTDEFLIVALNGMHPEKKMRPTNISESLIKKAEQLEEILRKRFPEPLTLPEYAELVTTNIQYISIAFKKRFNATIFEYRNMLRLERAKELLIEKPMDLESIAIEIGFYDASYLINAFKKKYEMTPAEYRRIAQEQK
jgi:AraC-like DNA-binding protein